MQNWILESNLSASSSSPMESPSEFIVAQDSSLIPFSNEMENTSENFLVKLKTNSLIMLWSFAFNLLALLMIK